MFQTLKYDLVSYVAHLFKMLASMESGAFVCREEGALTLSDSTQALQANLKGFQLRFKTALRGPVIADPTFVTEGNNKGLALDSSIEAEGLHR